MRPEERLQQRGVPGHLTTTEVQTILAPALTVNMISVYVRSHHGPCLPMGPTYKKRINTLAREWKCDIQNKSNTLSSLYLHYGEIVRLYPHSDPTALAGMTDHRTDAKSTDAHAADLLALRFLIFASPCSERLVDKGKDSSSCDRRSDEDIKFLVSTNGQLEMARCDTFYTEVFRCISSQLKHFGSEVFQDSGRVHGSLCAYPHIMLSTLFEISMDTTDRELQPSSLTPCLDCPWTR